VIEAQLTLLLRLSSARRSSVAEVTDDVHIIGKLINCKVTILLHCVIIICGSYPCISSSYS